MLLPFAFILLLSISSTVSVSVDDDGHNSSLRGSSGDPIVFTGQTIKSKHPSDPPFDGNRLFIPPPPPTTDNEVLAMNSTPGVSSPAYSGDVYQDTSNRPAENITAAIAEIWEGGDESAPPKKLGNSSDTGRTADFEIKNGMIRCIVEYKPLMKGQLLKGLKADKHYEFDDMNTVVISIRANLFKGLKRNPNILGIYPDSAIEIIKGDKKESTSMLFNRHHKRRLGQTIPYGISMLDVEWLKRKGEGIKVCVLDTGYMHNHNDLPNAVQWIGNGINPNNPPADINGHGTHVTGTIAALDNNDGVVGVSPGVGLVIGPLLEPSFLSDTIDGIRQCKEKGASVVNMSFGCPEIKACQGGNCYHPWYASRMTEFTLNDNMLLVASAGNHGSCPSNSDALNYPASYPDVLSVAAVDSDGLRAGFSAKNDEVNIAAPGVAIYSTYIGGSRGNYRTLDGTSMASPHVAGIAARVWSIMPWLTAKQLRTFLTTAAQYEHQAFTGAGLVNHGFFTIILQMSGKCLDNNGGYPKLYTCGIGYSNQMFTFDYFNNMIVGSDGMCLSSSGSFSGASVTFSSCNNNDSAQKFFYDMFSKQFTNRGYCLDNHGSYQFQNNGVVHMWNCNGGTNQKWLLGKDYETRLYQDNDMFAGGKMYRAPGSGRWSTMPIAIKNDRLTRVIIPQGFVFEYFEKDNFGGWQGLFGSQEFDINLYLDGHSDAVSSFKIRKLPDGKIRLCKHVDCSSEFSDIDWVKNEYSMPSTIGNDHLSAVLIPRGYQFQYFEHGGWKGWSSTAGSCSSAIFLPLVGRYNDAVSSFKIQILDCD